MLMLLGSGPGSLGDTSGYLSGGWELDTDVQDCVLTLTQEEEEEFWSAVGYTDTAGGKQRLVSVLSRLQHEDRLSMSSYGSEDVMSPRTHQSSADSHHHQLQHPGDSPASLGPFLTSLLNK